MHIVTALTVTDMHDYSLLKLVSVFFQESWITGDDKNCDFGVIVWLASSSTNMMVHTAEPSVPLCSRSHDECTKLSAIFSAIHPHTAYALPYFLNLRSH